jgi:hypothetical protein
MSGSCQLQTHAPQQREKVLEKPDALFARSRHLEDVRQAVGTKFSADRIYCRSSGVALAVGQCAIAAKTSATKIWGSGVHAESLCRPRQQIALLSQVPS